MVDLRESELRPGQAEDCDSVELLPLCDGSSSDSKKDGPAAPDPARDPAPAGDGTLRAMWRLVASNRAFRLLYFAQLVSWVGEFLSMTAVLTLVTELSDSSVAVALYFVCQSVPTLLLAPVTGPLVDRLNRYHLMIASDLVRASIVPFLSFVDRPERIWVLYAATVVIYSAQAFFDPARNAVMPLLMPSSSYPISNSLLSMSFGVALSLGGGTAGLVVAAAGFQVCFLVDAASYAASAAMVLAVKRGGAPAFAIVSEEDEARAGDPGGDGGGGGGGSSSGNDDDEEEEEEEATQAAEVRRKGKNTYAAVQSGDKRKARGGGLCAMYTGGIKYMLRERDLFALVLIKSLENVNLGIVDSALPRMARAHFRLHGSVAFTLGLLYTLSGLGSITPVIVSMLDKENSGASRRQWMGRAYTVEAVGVALICWSPHVSLFFLGSVLFYAGCSINYVAVLTEMQRAVDDEFSGRVFATGMLMRITGHVCGGGLYSLLSDAAGLSVRQASWPAVGLLVSNVFTVYCLYIPWWRRRQAAVPAEPAGDDAVDVV